MGKRCAFFVRDKHSYLFFAYTTVSPLVEHFHPYSISSLVSCYELGASTKDSPPPFFSRYWFFGCCYYTDMGLLAAILDKVCEHCSTQSIWMLSIVGVLSLLTISTVINVLRQLLFKNPKEPPVVFHWFPFIGSTVSYGMDPYKFFFDCKAKVGLNLITSRRSHISLFF